MEDKSPFLTSEYTEVNGFLMCFELKTKPDRLLRIQNFRHSSLTFKAQPHRSLLKPQSFQKENDLLKQACSKLSFSYIIQSRQEVNESIQPVNHTKLYGRFGRSGA